MFHGAPARTNFTLEPFKVALRIWGCKMSSVAVVTMAYNEKEYLPIWIEYYSKQVGANNLFIIDHGTEDGSTDNLKEVNVIRIPRSPKDNDRRTKAVSEFCRFLLKWYDSVIHTDCDEIVVADPDQYSGIAEYCEKTEKKVVTAIGLDVYQTSEDEPPLDIKVPVTKQRSFVRFSSSMCKPVLIKTPVDWSAGFHSCDSKVEFDHLFLFHMRYFDYGIGLDRLARTRAMAWASPHAGSHQRMPDEDYMGMVRRAGMLPKNEDITLSPNDPILGSYIKRVLDTEKDVKPPQYRIDLHIFGEQQWRIPQRFVGIF